MNTNLKNGLVLMFVGAVVLGVILFAYSYFSSQKVIIPASIASQVNVPTSTGTSTVTSLAGCPSSLQTNFQSVYQNTLNTGSAAYVTNVRNYALFKNTGVTGQKGLISGTNSTGTSTYSTAVTISCSKTVPYVYDFIALTKRVVLGNDGATSVTISDIVADSDVKVADFKGKVTDSLTVSIKNKNDGDKFLNYTSGDNCDSACTGFVGINGNWTDQSGTTDLAALTSRGIWLEIQVRSNRTNTQFGEDGLPTYVAIDADVTQYEVPTVSSNLQLLQDKSGLSDTDKAALSTYEYVYAIDSRISNVQSTFSINIPGKSGVTYTQDPKIRFIATGKDLSTRDGTKIITGAFLDDSSYTEIAYTKAQEITIDITSA